jgi:hypothetical protein
MFIELKLFIDVSSSGGKIAFGILKGNKMKDYEDGNANLAREKMKKKFDSVSTPAIVTAKRMFREGKPVVIIQSFRFHTNMATKRICSVTSFTNGKKTIVKVDLLDLVLHTD